MLFQLRDSYEAFIWRTGKKKKCVVKIERQEERKIRMFFIKTEFIKNDGNFSGAYKCSL